MVAFFINFDERGKTCMGIALILTQSISQTLGSNFDGL